MGIPVLILGESGTGKTASLMNFSNEEVFIINVDSKMLPFKNSFKHIWNCDSAVKIAGSLGKIKEDSIVIDDAQYIMANAYMSQAMEKGFDKFTLLGKSFFDIIEACKSLPQDKIIYFLMHTETVDGTIKAKTIGKLLNEKITLEGKFTICLRTAVHDGGYFFTTQNSGADTVKSPIGMFEKNEIPNDLKLVDETIRNFYFGGTK